MQGSIRNTFLFFLLLFLLLLVWLTYIQVWAAPGLSRNPRNTRALEQQMRIERGEILTADGLPLVVNRRAGPYYLRDYPQGSLASPVSYTHLRAHETDSYLVCRLLLEKKKKTKKTKILTIIHQ